MTRRLFFCSCSCSRVVCEIRWLARPEANINSSLVDQQLPLLLNVLPDLQSALGKIATQRATLQLEAHERVREAMRTKAKVAIEPVLPVDILGAYLLLPVL